MLIARDLTLRRGPEALFEQVNFTVSRGDKVGLTGANGTGKSSLLAAIHGEFSPDRGDLTRPDNLRIAYVEQEIAAGDRPAIEFVLDGDSQLRNVLAAIEDAERRDAALELAELYATLQSIDGYRARARAAALMHGLGFRHEDLERSVAEFSGGWRVRLAMAQALGSRADLLLLDEPTNHLDLDAIVWLEEWLKAFSGTLVMVSHDREFLDSIIDRVLHIDHGTVTGYFGNYSQFEAKRAEELARHQSMYARQRRQIAAVSAFVNRFRASANRSRQAQSRLKMLQRMQRIVPAHVDNPFEFEFAAPVKLPRPLLTLERASCGHGNRIVIDGIDVTINPGDRIALLGPNGAGKSTVTKMLAGEAAPMSGTRVPAAELAVGYFAQQQLEQLHSDCDAFWHVRNRGGADFASADEQSIRDHLGRFGFRGDRAFCAAGRFSGGEKARLTLALLVARRPNLLLLDEPTNHLDIDMRQALTVALQEYTGGLLVVSHDRHLIKTVADTLWLVADGRWTVFDGDLDDYQQWLRARAKRQHPTKPKPAKGRPLPGDERSVRLQELARLERRLAVIGAERERAADVRGSAKAQRLDAEAALLEARWLEVGTALEAADAENADGL